MPKDVILKKIKDVQRFKIYANPWKGVNHHFKYVHDRVEWASPSKKWAHRNCKSLFFHDKYLNHQPTLEIPPQKSVNEEPSQHDENGEEKCGTLPRRSCRKMLNYESSWKEPDKKRCIICYEEKKEKGRVVQVQTISITEKAEKTAKICKYTPGKQK